MSDGSTREVATEGNRHHVMDVVWSLWSFHPEIL